jgi:sodium transport system ATP-binding protein
MSEAELLCDRILFIHAGHITDSGTLTELLTRTGCSNLTDAFLMRARETAPLAS